MIFRLNGNIEETLALTPVIKEWKIMNIGKVWTDTLYPELFIGNPYVDGVINNKVKSDWVLDFNTVNWQSNLRPVVESFAELLLGKVTLRNWRTIMYHTLADEDMARRFVSTNCNVVVVANGINRGIDTILKQKGYEVLRLPEESFGSLNIFHAVLSMANLYIGFDDSYAAIALTTDIPAVIIYTYRNPVYFAPFRRGIPFEAIVPLKEVCDISELCLKTNGFFEAGKTYGIKCSKKEIFCAKELSAECIISAIDRILEKA